MCTVEYLHLVTGLQLLHAHTTFLGGPVLEGGDRFDEFVNFLWVCVLLETEVICITQVHLALRTVAVIEIDRVVRSIHYLIVVVIESIVVVPAIVI
jgi:hypothetical protein